MGVFERLWFDVEKRYNTTPDVVGKVLVELWFDVEKRYNTTRIYSFALPSSCGLM